MCVCVCVRVWVYMCLWVRVRVSEWVSEWVSECVHECVRVSEWVSDWMCEWACAIISYRVWELLTKDQLITTFSYGLPRLSTAVVSAILQKPVYFLHNDFCFGTRKYQNANAKNGKHLVDFHTLLVLLQPLIWKLSPSQTLLTSSAEHADKRGEWGQREEHFWTVNLIMCHVSRG